MKEVHYMEFKIPPVPNMVYAHSSFSKRKPGGITLLNNDIILRGKRRIYMAEVMNHAPFFSV